MQLKNQGLRFIWNLTSYEVKGVPKQDPLVNLKKILFRVCPLI